MITKEQLSEILTTNKWIKVTTHKPLSMGLPSMDDLLDDISTLNTHHVEETTFLINTARTLANELMHYKKAFPDYKIPEPDKDEPTEEEKIILGE